VNQLQAFRDTLALVDERDMAYCEFETPEVNYSHLQDMLQRIENDPSQFSEAKLGRWLGYVQGVIVATDYGTLEEMKQINKRNS
jgi:hypothetical protein